MGELHFRYPDEYEEVILQLKKFVIQNYGSLHGHLGLVIVRYIKEGLERDLAIAKEPSTSLSPTKRHIFLLRYILDHFTDEITRTDIEQIIERNFGIDRRTKRKYLNFLIKGRFIEVLKPLYTNVIYKVNHQRILDFLKKNMSEEEFKTINVTIVQQPAAVVDQPNNGNKESIVQAAKQYAADRYEAGDTVEEITERLEDFGLTTTKAVVRNFIRKSLRGDEF